ncbi:MAG: M12 family metallo-peptidase [Rudaea sp.]
MKYWCLVLSFVSFASLAGAPSLHASERLVDRATMHTLSALPRGHSLRLQAFPVGPEQVASIRFTRVPIYADDAHIYVTTASGKIEVPRSDRIFFRGYSDDGSARVALSLQADARFAEGNGDGPQGPFALKASANADGSFVFNAVPLESTLPSPDAFSFQCGNESMALGGLHAKDLATRLHLATSANTAAATAAVSSSLRYATVAIDTDSLFMSRLFSNNTTNATNWIAGMFNSMNTMYENDLQVQLLIGTTILRTNSGTDPYTGLAQNSAANGADLNLFGSYWKTNESAVSRSFAILLSGAIASSSNSCSAAGIAWIDEYCQNGFTSGSNTVGSYSVNKVCTSINVDPNGSFDARIVGHEIGHNFGASHTHCTDVSTGNAPVATNTIDTCYNGEGTFGCYAGSTLSCPAGGHGSIMSYCNVTGCGTQNLLQFHSTQINQVLLPRISANTPSCLSATDVIFADGFQ